MAVKLAPGWRARIFTRLFGIGLLIGLPAVAIADSVSLSWDTNPEKDLAGYKVHIGTSPRKYTRTIDVGHLTSFRISGLFPGETYFIAVTAYDIFANESGPSAELIATIPEPPRMAKRFVDDVVFSTTRVGCLPDVADTTPPKPPTGVRIGGQ